MPIGECLHRHTHRQYLASLEWLELQWNVPSRSDYFLMRIAQRVQQVLSKNPNRIKLESQKVEFGREGDGPKISKEQATAWSKARWLGFLGRFSSRKKKRHDRHRD